MESDTEFNQVQIYVRGVNGTVVKKYSVIWKLLCKWCNILQLNICCFKTNTLEKSKKYFDKETARNVSATYKFTHLYCSPRRQMIDWNDMM